MCVHACEGVCVRKRERAQFSVHVVLWWPVVDMYMYILYVPVELSTPTERDSMEEIF